MLLPGFPPELWTLLSRAAAPGRVALVGGAVRDLLLHREHRDPWRGITDLDLVVESGDSAGGPPAQGLLKALHDAPGVKVLHASVHDLYGTVEVELDLEGRVLLLDLASARRERYPVPAGRPVVEFGCLEDDLSRRDFSINAMALVLSSSGDDPILLDPHAGLADLKARELRLLHPASLRDDPTRLVRAARYAARLALQLEPSSLAQAHAAMDAWPWPPCSSASASPGLGTRLRMEMELLLEHEPWEEALTNLEHWGGLALLDRGLQFDGHWRQRLRWARRFGVNRLPALLCGAGDPLAIAARLQLSHSECGVLQQWMILRDRLESDALPITVQGWTEWLEQPDCSAKAVGLALAACNGPRRPLLRWWLSWRHLSAPVSATELMRVERLLPGPQVGIRLRQLRAERLRRESL